MMLNQIIVKSQGVKIQKIKMADDEPPDCKYKQICKWYANDCYEPKCWRSKQLEGILKEGLLEKLNNMKVKYD